MTALKGIFLRDLGTEKERVATQALGDIEVDDFFQQFGHLGSLEGFFDSRSSRARLK